MIILDPNHDAIEVLPHSRGLDKLDNIALYILLVMPRHEIRAK